MVPIQLETACIDVESRVAFINPPLDPVSAEPASSKSVYKPLLSSLNSFAWH